MSQFGNQYREGDFPWLPGQSHVTPHPAYSFKEYWEPPRWLMVTLEALDAGADPEGLPPIVWLNAIKADRDCVDAMRAFGRECFNVFDNGDATHWHASSGVLATELPDRDAWWRIWSGYCALLLTDLNKAQENVSDAVKRIPAQWQLHVTERSRRFWTEFEHASVWPPKLALVWILYGGKRESICRYFLARIEGTKRPDLLDWVGFSLEDDVDIVNPQPADVLAVAMRRSTSHPQRVIVKGLVEGSSMLSTIEPDDLARLDWLAQEGAGWSATAVLAPIGYGSMNRLPIVSNVVIERESLWAAFPPLGHPMRTATGAIKPMAFAAEHRADAIKRIETRGDRATAEAIGLELRAMFKGAGGVSTATAATFERYSRESQMTAIKRKKIAGNPA